VFDFVSVVVSSGIISIGEKTMKAELIVRRGVIAVAFAGLFAGGTYANSQDPTPQQQDIQNDKKDIRSDKKDWRRIVRIAMPISGTSITINAT